MIVFCVELKAFLSVPVKSLSADAANETNILAVFIGLTFLVSQLCKCINDDTENNIEQDCDDEQEEGQIVGRTEVETLFVLGGCCLGW